MKGDVDLLVRVALVMCGFMAFAPHCPAFLHLWLVLFLFTLIIICSHGEKMKQKTRKNVAASMQV